MNRNIRKRAFLLVTAGIIDDVVKSIKDFNFEEQVNKLKKLFQSNPEVKEEIKREIGTVSPKPVRAPTSIKPTIKSDKSKSFPDYMEELKLFMSKDDGKDGVISIGSKNQSVLNNAMSDIGFKETEGDNIGPEIRSYFSNIGINIDNFKEKLPWCAAAASTWLIRAGVPIKGSASSLELAGQFSDKLIKPEKIKEEHLVPGNVAFWYNPGKTGRGHVGIIQHATMQEIKTIDGNSGPDGGSVAERNRPFAGEGDLKLYGIGLVSEM